MWILKFKIKVKKIISSFVKNYDTKTRKILLGIVGVAFLLFIGAIISQEVAKKKSVEVLKRNNYEEGDYSTELFYKIDGSEKRGEIVIEVPNRAYTEKEILEHFKQLKANINKLILGKNKSLSQVNTDLKLMTQVPNCPITIGWFSTDLSVIDWEGKIGEGAKKEGSKVRLVANLEFEEYQQEVELETIVFPKKLKGELAFKEELRGKIKEIDQQVKGEKYLTLPKNVGGKPIVFNKKNQFKPESVLILLFIAIVGVLIGARKDKDVANNKIRYEMELDYPVILNKLFLYMNAGLSCRSAFERITIDYESRIKKNPAKAQESYALIVATYYDMCSSGSEIGAYRNMATRAESTKYKSLGYMLAQNIKRGNQNLLNVLETQALEAFEERKRNAKIIGEKAGTKLLLPMALMLLIVLVIILVPACLSF